MICHYCQRNIPQEASFCPVCGHRTKNATVKPQAEAPMPTVRKPKTTKRKITLKQVVIITVAMLLIQITIGLIFRFAHAQRMEKYKEQLEVERRIDERLLHDEQKFRELEEMEMRKKNPHQNYLNNQHQNYQDGL